MITNRNELNPSQTYRKSDNEEISIIKERIEEYCDKYNFDKENIDKFPYFYSGHKLHKNPTGNRHISASAKCSTKPISELLTITLSKLLETRTKYCQTIYNATKINQMWVIGNNNKFLEIAEKMSKNRKAKQIDTFDFSTLYTNIDLEDLKDKLIKLIEQIFKNTSKYIIANINTKRAYWSNKIPKNSIKNKHIHVQTKEIIISHITFLIDNIYTSFCGEIYQQIIGIPMGTDCAPLLANLYLHYYEYEYMTKLRKDDYRLALKFSNTCRYIDDLATINNPLFDEHVKHIYPDTLTLNKENISPMSATFLDIHIKIQNKQLILKVYDKGDDFKFTINSFPHTTSNINISSAINVYTSQLIRYARICTHQEDFHKKHRQTTQKLINNGFQKSNLIRKFKSFTERNHELLQKWNFHKRQNSTYIKEGFKAVINTQ